MFASNLKLLYSKRLPKRVILTSFVILMLLAFIPPVLGDVFTTDFETGDHQGWAKTGDAFDFQPTKGDNPTARNRGQPSNHEGKWWIGGFEKYQGKSGQKAGDVQGDSPKGTLTSAPFGITGEKINFLIGGGNYPIGNPAGATAVVLVVDDKNVRKATGKNHETMKRIEWNVGEFKGRPAVIKIIDENSGGWGHINCDDFNMLDAAGKELPFSFPPLDIVFIVLTDLKVINVKAEPKPAIINGRATFTQGKAYSIKVAVKNVGPSSVNDAEVIMHYGGQHTDISGIGYTGPIGVGGTKYAIILFTPSTIGTYRVQFEIDPGNKILESDESELSNIWDMTFDVVSQPLLVPGLVLGLRHNMNQEMEGANYMIFFSAPAGAPVQRMHGGDLKAPLHRGYDWWMVQDGPESNPASYNLPPGIVLGLKHSVNQASAGIGVFGSTKVTVFGYDPVSGPESLPSYGFKKQHGGDLGASSGQGYYWYESTGEGFSDWSLVDRLPRWTILGLKHSRNQKDKKVTWQGKIYDPANPIIAPPPGFERKSGGDRDGSSGEGYYWYEKVTGPEVVVKPTLQVKLARSLFLEQTDDPNEDKDQDGLIDSLENDLATAFSPLIIFDSAEKARQVHEPVTLFQVRKMDIGGITSGGTTISFVGIKWVFLFKEDGGYGPDSSCGDAHAGDNDDAFYELESRDGGVTWTLIGAGLSSRGVNSIGYPSFAGPEWPKNSRLEVYDLTHPIIYMSAHKHHEYFTRDNDHDDSRYSSWGCNDDVNGLGDKFLVDLQSIAKKDPNFSGYNNVGEFKSHPTPPFVNDLSSYYLGHSAWGNKDFYKVGPIKDKWLK